MRCLILPGLLAITMALCPGVVRAQTEPKPMHAEWELGPRPESGWTVGDRIPLRLQATYPASLEVTLPELPQEWGPFEVLEQTLLEPRKNQHDTLTAVRDVTVTLWAPGDYQIPPLTVRYRDGAGQLHEVAVPSQTVTVASVLKEGETEKHDLKAQISLPRPPVLPWILGGLTLGLLGGVVAWILLRRLQHPTASTFSPALPYDPRQSHEIAYDELDRIAALDLPAQGELKHHYTLVADCLRNYSQRRYRIPAMDQTTEELIVAFRQVRVNHGHVGLFRQLLTEADLVKFAKFRPPIAQARGAVDHARHIVDVTKPAEPESSIPNSQYPVSNTDSHT